jgi:bacillithiol biosynthesis cysteine-adding enzyme BshC
LNWFADEARSIRYEPERRARVCSALERQNRFYQSSPRTFENLQRLRSGACAAVTGQQVSLFGGPLFSILKALTAARIAERATAEGVDCVPVFWLATEDHDLAEVNHAVLPGNESLLLRLETSTQGVPDTPVGQLRFGAEIEPLVAQAVELLGGEIGEVLREAYRPGASFGDAFGRLFAHIFRDAGVILLDASDPELHEVAAPLYEEAIRRSAELYSRLEARGAKLREGGFHEQVKVSEASTLLFGLQDGVRRPVHCAGDLPAKDPKAPARYSLGQEELPEAELLARIRRSPANFSPNVLLRPVVQDYLLPTLAYVGGPAEVAYFAQAGAVYEALLKRVTPVLPRLGVTVVEPRIKRLLDRYQLKVSDTFQPPAQLRELLGERSLPEDLQTNFAAAAASLESLLASLAASLSRMDVTLAAAAERAGAKMRYQLEHLRVRAANAELQRSEVVARHAAQLSSALYPERTLQERVIAGVYFLARHPDLLQLLQQTASLDCSGHQVVFL